jgi:hypothetical protein
MLDGYQIFDADAHAMMSPNMWTDRHSMVLLFAYRFYALFRSGLFLFQLGIVPKNALLVERQSPRRG